MALPPPACAGGASFLHYHTHSKESSPLGLPRGTPACPRIGNTPVGKPGFHRDKPRGEQFEVACEGSAQTRFHRSKPGWGASLGILFRLA